MSQEEPDFLARLKSAIRLAGGNKVVSQRGEIPLSTLTTWLSGVAEPKVSGLKKLCEATDASPNELLGWEALQDRALVEILPADAVAIPLKDGRGAAEPGAAAVMSFPLAILQRLGVKPASVAALIASGDGMAPTICSSALVLIDTSRREPDEGVFAFIVDDQTRLRRIAQQTDGGVLLISDAPHYPSERLSADQAARLQIVGRAIWTEKAL